MGLRIVEKAALSDVGRQRQGNEDSYLERSPLFVVADLASTNGVKVNGRRVAEHRLTPGDEITLGLETLHFEVE